MRGCLRFKVLCVVGVCTRGLLPFLSCMCVWRGEGVQCMAHLWMCLAWDEMSA
jgi:hypothetical protein